ncbi:MAG: alpha/beta fold hydrolase [Cyanobacteria bacterium]|jgi:triacylglycerol lipase|nr:alpha/beta fold hydrolase [Cyanobacteriota bacterium]
MAWQPAVRRGQDGCHGPPPLPPSGSPLEIVPPPLVLVHGLWDTPELFNSLKRSLAGRRGSPFSPHLPHGLGVVPLDELAAHLNQAIEAEFGPDQILDVMGFSMGGLISRTWIQLQGGYQRVRRFTSVASPQQGTLAAQVWPRWPLASVADMKLGSDLLRRLNGDSGPLATIDCCSIYCVADVMVVPGWTAVLPVGRRLAFPLHLAHHELMARPEAVDLVTSELLRP